VTIELLTLAIEAARGAGELLMKSFGGDREEISTKSSPTDLVSKADRDSERFLLDIIASERPNDGILAEEGGRAESSTGYRWVIDPLDGTINFLFRIPVWAVSLAVEDPDGGVVGVVYDPNRDEMFTAQRGEGAWLDGRRLTVSTRADLTTALVGTGFAYEATRRIAQARIAAEVLGKVRDIRRAGSAALDLCSVACSRLDGFFEAYTQPWDRAAGALIVTEAGGVVTEGPAPVGEGTTIVASNEILHGELRRLVLDN
jgi:myo-inositol-1(or 4)-monophosphatase